MGVLKLAILEYKRMYPETIVVSFTAPELKKYATGNSKATKEEVMATINVRNMNKITGSVLEGSVDDVSDAFYAAKYGLEVYKNGTYVEHLSK
jgi:Holliday junction resolvasome RuvABC endonuclease subunit